MGLEHITAKELLRRYKAEGKRKFTKVSLSDQSLRGADLRGVEFIKSSIRGCDLQDANLENSNFIETSFGTSIRQHVLILVYKSSQLAEIPISREDFGFSLLFPCLWLYGVSVGFLIITFFLIQMILSSIIGFLTGVLGYRQVFVSILLNSIPLSMVTSLLVLDIKRTLNFYTENRVKSICINLMNANFENVVFSKSKISNCDFSNSRLVDCRIENSEIENSVFTNSHLKGLSLRDSRLFNSKFSISDKILRLLTTLDGRKEEYRGYDLSGFDLSNANLKEADLNGAKLISTNLNHANLESATLDNCDARGIQLMSSNLKKSSLFAIDLSAACLKYADIRQANLAASRVMGVDFSEANLSGACISDWQISSTCFRKVKCSHIFLEFSYQLKRYMTRVPANEKDFLKRGEFEDNISQVYRLMARILQYGPEYMDEIRKEISSVEKSSENNQAFREDLDRLKKMVDTFENNVLPGSTRNVIFAQAVNSFFGDVMSGEINKKNIDGSMGGDSIVQSGRDISNSNINQDTSSPGSIQKEDFRENILQALNQALKVIGDSQLSDMQKEEVISYMESAKKEANKEVPRKERIAQNLEWFKESMKSLDGTTDSVKNLVDKLKEPCIILTRLLSMAFPLLP